VESALLRVGVVMMASSPPQNNMIKFYFYGQEARVPPPPPYAHLPCLLTFVPSGARVRWEEAHLWAGCCVACAAT
jgi:hypothetical protein